MRIITVNLPKPYLEAIDKMTGRQGLFPSRSELIRVAVREWILKEIQAAKKFKQYVPIESTPVIYQDPNQICFEDGTTFTLKPRVVSP